MSEIDHIIAVAGWEDRFLLGLMSDVSVHKPSSILLLTFEEYRDMTEANRSSLRTFCIEEGVTLNETTLRRMPQEIWFSLRQALAGPDMQRKNVLLDISTMPREVIWWSLKFLQASECSVRYVYHRPLKYAEDWLTRDTGEPRLVYQFSGVAQLGQSTALLLLSGFDLDRALRMIQYFEPATVLLAIQNGAQFSNDIKNAIPSQKMSTRIPRMTTFEMDAYSEDRGYQALLEATQPHLKDHNIIAASLGPKVSGISLFRLHSAYPEIALAYAPSRQFNSGYSEGLGSSVDGSVPITPVAADSMLSRAED